MGILLNLALMWAYRRCVCDERNCYYRRVKLSGFTSRASTSATRLRMDTRRYWDLLWNVMYRKSKEKSFNYAKAFRV